MDTLTNLAFSISRNASIVTSHSHPSHWSPPLSCAPVSHPSLSIRRTTCARFTLRSYNVQCNVVNLQYKCDLPDVRPLRLFVKNIETYRPLSLCTVYKHHTGIRSLLRTPFAIPILTTVVLFIVFANFFSFNWKLRHAETQVPMANNGKKRVNPIHFLAICHIVCTEHSICCSSTCFCPVSSDRSNFLNFFL